MKRIKFVGLDVHAETITVAVAGDHFRVTNNPPRDSQPLEVMRGILQRLEFQHSIAWRDRVHPRHRDLLFRIVRTRSKIGELRECKGNSLGLQYGAAISHLQVQVRTRRVAAVTEERERISAKNMVARPYFDASSLQVGVSDKEVLCNSKNDVVSGDVVQCDRR